MLTAEGHALGQAVAEYGARLADSYVVKSPLTISL
jgi:hypothetical protein